MKIWQILAVLPLCLVLVSSLSCNVLGGGADNQEEVSWEQVEVVRGDLTISVSGAGNIDIANEVNLSFETSKGKVDKIYVSVGDEVSQDEVLAELAQLDIDALELAVFNAKVALEQAKYDLHDLEEIQRASYEKVRIAELEVEAAELELAQAEKDLENETITAPFDGVVAGIGAEEGDIINAGDMVTHLIDTTTMELGVQVDEIDIPKIKLNQKAVITLDALPTVQFDGSVNAIGPVPVEEDGVVVYDVTIGLNVPEGYNIKVGMSATAEIIVNTKRNVLLVPSRAIMQNEQGKPMLRVPVNGQVQPRPIVTGLSNGLQTEIVEGVSQGEIVVIPVLAGTEPSGSRWVPGAGRPPPGMFPGGRPPSPPPH